MAMYKTSKHSIGSHVRKIPNDGKERDRGDEMIRTCGVDGYSFKTGSTTSMWNHKAAKHNIGKYKIPDDGK